MICSSPDRRSVELNEVGWWSKWARLKWRGEGYLLSSADLKEPFFNRAGVLACKALNVTVAWAEPALFSEGVDSTLLIFDSCASAERLLVRGYEQTDTMTVLRAATQPTAGGPEVEVRASTGSDDWTAAYLRSFYGGEELTDVVRPIVSSLPSKPVTLLEARSHGETAGVLAMFRTKGVAGVYCVGTAPEFRRRGVASSLLARAEQIASTEGRSLILQTLNSDGALRFYLRRGFEVMYSKRVLTRKLK